MYRILNELSTIKNPLEHKQKMTIEKPSTLGKMAEVSRELLDQAYHYILENTDAIQPYVE